MNQVNRSSANNPITGNEAVAYYQEHMQNNPKLQTFINNFGPEEK